MASAALRWRGRELAVDCVSSGSPTLQRPDERFSDRSDTMGVVSPRQELLPIVLALALAGCGSSVEPQDLIGFTLRIVSGDRQNGRVAETLPEPLVVRVRDSLGTPQPGIPVTFSAPVDQAQLNPTTVKTDADGMASAVAILGPKFGDILGNLQVRAEVVGSGLRVDFQLRALAGAPAEVRIVGGNDQVGFT